MANLPVVPVRPIEASPKDSPTAPVPSLPSPIGHPKPTHTEVEAWKEDKSPKTPVTPAATGRSPSFQGSSFSPRRSVESDGQVRRSSLSKKEMEAKARSRKSVARNALMSRKWYHSDGANKIRDIVKGKYFGAVMIVCLVLALFLPDCWVLAGVNSNTEIDVMLSMVMLLFTVEFFSLSLLDANYLLSFFFWMDIVGTLSMMFDITYLLGKSFGSDHTEPRELDGGNTARNVMLLRATRAAKVGARAGRLSRVLRVLRYLPFLTGSHKKDQHLETGISTVISLQLSNLLATRVACLTIILVMVLPLFEFWSFPMNDHSLRTWTSRLSRNIADGRLNDTVAELDVMAEFYSGRSYGPYFACIGRMTDIDNCDSWLTGWKPSLDEPPRGGSIQLVRVDTLTVGFNMHGPKQIEAAMSICTVLFIIFLMIFSGLALSSVVTELAVRPLERMLNTVRQIATTVFHLTQGLEDDPKNEETADIETSSEMKLLEKVVQKLAAIAALQSKQDDNINTEDMRDEDIGILSMMQGKDISKEVDKGARKSRAVVAGAARRKVAMTLRFEDFGVTSEVYNSFSFTPVTLSKAQRCTLSVYVISNFHDSADAFLSEQDPTLQRFVQAAEKEYLPNPFHNFAHAADVLHCVSRIMRLMNSDAFLSPLEQFTLLVGALGHDLGHPGVNNPFLIEVGHSLALQYNDRSPCENMHCAKLYNIVANPEANIFRDLTREQYKDTRKMIIETILHTDMITHQAMVKDLQMMYQMNTEVFKAGECHQQQSAQQPEAQAAESPESELFAQSEHKATIMNCILHSADVSNPCRAWEVTEAWAMLCLEEFFAQGDQEKMLAIPVQFLNDRDKLNKPNSQIGFIEFMIAPFFCAQIRLFPSLHEFGDHLASNIEVWMELWEGEVSPSEEEKAKVAGRVQRCRTSLEHAFHRIDPVAAT
eukprot:TRINITY_DN8939_c0_g1_i1.p1 TRINITY_DN8939_c0_g1~~TRINITY_DN8939_c0_g1_i1.p1  ORF type:complete len:934 (-),score=209.72 TRINITY_DN8939_c0_g1_i1:157-2958(-)